jgi:hypothetical protein
MGLLSARLGRNSLGRIHFHCARSRQHIALGLPRRLTELEWKDNAPNSTRRLGH